MRHILIDTDTASDDAVALMMALKYPGVNIEAITVVGGNVPLDKGVQNALYVVEQCEVDVPVYEGAAKPLLRDLYTAQFVHGEDGMGDIGLELNNRKAAEGSAVDVIINKAYEFTGALELITLGPLTNLAIALLKDPNIADKIKVCTIMGGVGQGPGNITPVSEYNIWVDPEATKIVLASGMKIKMAGWDIALNHAFFDGELIKEWQKIESHLARVALSIQQGKRAFNLKTNGEDGFELPDPIAITLAFDEESILSSKELLVDVVLADGPTRGQVIVDHTGNMNQGHKVELILEASRELFINMLFQTFLV